MYPGQQGGSGNGLNNYSHPSNNNNNNNPSQWLDYNSGGLPNHLLQPQQHMGSGSGQPQQGPGSLHPGSQHSGIYPPGSSPSSLHHMQLQQQQRMGSGSAAGGSPHPAIYHPGSSPSPSSSLSVPSPGMTSHQQHLVQMAHHMTQNNNNIPQHSQSHVNQHYYPYPTASPVQQQRSSYQQQNNNNSSSSNSNNNPANYSSQLPSPYSSFSAMQSPPPSMIGSPGQPFSNSSNHSNPSPTRSMSSPSFPMGSPLMRQFSGGGGPPSVSSIQVTAAPTTPSPHPLPPSPSPSAHSQASPAPAPPPPLPTLPSSSSTPSSVTAAVRAPVKKSAAAPSTPAPSKTIPLTNGKPKSSSDPPPVPAAPAMLHSESIVEEPLPPYPSPEDLEHLTRHIRPMIPEAMLNRIMAKAGITFADPKIGILISLAGQALIHDIVKDAVAMGQQQGQGQPPLKGQMLLRKNLEKVLQEHGMKQLPGEPFPGVKSPPPPQSQS